MKFYYNDKLIRTSKTHEYKYAVLHNGKTITCSATRQGAESTAFGSRRAAIARLEGALRGEGFRQYGTWHTAAEIIKGYGGREAVQAWIDQLKAWINECQIVELEARA